MCIRDRDKNTVRHACLSANDVFGKRPAARRATGSAVQRRQLFINLVHFPQLFHRLRHIGIERADVIMNQRLFPGGIPPVSYTHLDVYKRQALAFRRDDLILQKILADACGTLLIDDMRHIFILEIPKRTEYRVRRGLAESAERGLSLIHI